MAEWENTSVEDILKAFQDRKYPPELYSFLERKKREVQSKPLLKHILPFLNAYELMKVVPAEDGEQGIVPEKVDDEEENNVINESTQVKSYGDCQLLFDYLGELKEQPLKKLSCKSPRYLKIFNDPIHGHIQLHPACQMIVDTPEFQRLRDIKQIGTVYYVYPGAAHNRFEHSLGVCHLAGQFARALRESQPELGITEVDILCVELAGLCRDLGHGPFSGLYLNKFLPAMNKEKKYRKPSAEMFEHLLSENNLREKLSAYGITDADRQFIKEQLEGARPTGSTAWPYKGRTKEKAYLYEIVVNHRNGIDVYKWDYLARDCHHLGIKNNFDPSRYMKFARVIEMEGEMQICTRDKEISNLYNMFYTRYTVNKFAYFHKVACGIELMIVKALEKANRWITFQGINNKCNIYECHQDMRAFQQLSDNVIFMIRNFPLEKDRPTQEREGERWDDMNEAQELIARIFRRDLYSCVYEAPPCSPKDLENRLGVENILDELEIIIKERILEKANLLEDDVIVKIISLHFGMKEENPVERLKVYSKHRLNEARHLKKEEASQILRPVKFNEVQVRIYSTKSSKDDSGQRRIEIEKCAKEILEP